MPMSNYPNAYDPALPVLCTSSDVTMPSRDDSDDRARRRRREKEIPYDRDSPSPRDKQGRSSQQLKIGGSGTKLHKRRSPSREREKESPRPLGSDRREGKKVSVVMPEMDRRKSGGGGSGAVVEDDEERRKTSYPTFSKAHSREAVGSREDMGKYSLTPEATELDDGQEKKEKERRRNSTPANANGGMPGRPPPSPPLTADNPDLRRPGSGESMRSMVESVRAGTDGGRKSMESTPKAKPNEIKNVRSTASLGKDARIGESDISSMPGAFPEESERKSTPVSIYRRTVSTSSQPVSTVTQDTTTDSDATSIAPDRKEFRQMNNQTPLRDTSRSDFPPPRPQTPPQEYSIPPKAIRTPFIDVNSANLNTPQSFGMTPLTAVPPPPPPPPPLNPNKPVPRVDYLLKNGGLSSLVPKRLVQITSPVQPYSMYQSPVLLSQPPLEDYAKIFSTLHKRLDDYMHVVRGNGSLAVATGYKSVARRLLDKLSQIFARDISSQRCDCVVCNTTPQPALSDEEDSGISWGEILEFVSGRRELPQWPPFSIQPDDSGLGITGATQAPMQKLDVDVPEEYRDHYIRQNQKTKRAVQNWLSQQPDLQSSPPEEADEDTLMFAMMTKLNVELRNYFIALMHGQSTVSETRAPTPAERPSTSSTALRRARQALQRLYRLDRPPRDCESAMYLLNNPHLHSMLATLAEVNEQEWDILVSGRFDGFLWSGAETPFPASMYASPSISRVPSRNANPTPFSHFSRNATPFSGLSAMPASRTPAPFSPLRNPASPFDNGAPHLPFFPSRGPTPGPCGITGVTPPAPVQMDEDTEIAVLAEVERNLFSDMERFEDAFEVLHSRAEMVRQMLRERSAGLSMQAQLRRGSGASAAYVRLDTPASGVTDISEGWEEDDDGLGDVASLAPDDSASQISVQRRQRHHRRHERKNTPAPVLTEEDESAFEEEKRGHAQYAGGGRKSKH